jgi:hypothetical protein
MLERMIGLEQKERLIQWLARRGIATRDRRETLAEHEALAVGWAGGVTW